MLQSVTVGRTDPADYAEIVGGEWIWELWRAAERLRGCRVLHLSSASRGTPTSELLRWLVPLTRGLGVDSEWRALAEPSEVAQVRHVRNAVGEQRRAVPQRDWNRWVSLNYRIARALEGHWDVCVVHDLDLALVAAIGQDAADCWVWRPVIGAAPGAEFVDQLGDYVTDYHGMILEAPIDGCSDLVPRMFVIRLGIDPLASTNVALDPGRVDALCWRTGVAPDRPLIVSMARFGPLAGVEDIIDAYRALKHEMPLLQLALIASTSEAGEDGSAYETLSAAALGDRDLHMYAALGGIETNALRSRATVIVQASLPPVSGLDVLGAFWKSKPVVVRDAVGIEAYIDHGVSGLVADSVDSFAKQVRELLTDDELARRLGAAGRIHVGGCGIAPRLMRDWLETLGGLVTRADCSPLIGERNGGR